MDILLSSILGEITSRSINFFISKVSKRSLLDVEDRLRQVLLRAQVIIDEAMGWHITNQAMIIQLGMLRDAMHRGHYMLDTFRYQPDDAEETKDHVVSCSSSLPIVNSVKHLLLSSRGDLALKELQERVDDLSSMIIDANELVQFLTSYPRLYCQPYSMHLQLANCMFDRQMEAQQVINFLLHQQPINVEELDVMPIVGPGHVGKSTLVAHVCKDERERAHFSGILFFDIRGFTNDELAAFRDECELKHQNLVSKSNLDRLLVVIELIEDLNEEAWSRLYSASKQYMPKGSKIIVTSRFESIVNYGTTQALTMKYVSHEAYWYFFKTLTFGSMDPKMIHPRLTHLAMEIAKMLRRSHAGANIFACLLRDNFNIHFWIKVFSFLRGNDEENLSRFAEHPFDLLNKNRPALIVRMTTPSDEIVLHRHQQRSSEEEVPKITFQDIMCGSVKVHGKFEALGWRSMIPPYYSYVHTCEALKLKTRCKKRKHTI